ncbi:hypothetical protein FRC05_008009 [Tulasnella sp. 425]|nr:hypothetical protein FRC05_008009 [Tulasnella sp. 425]
MAEHHRPPVADNNPSYGKLDGWTPPPAPKEAPHKTIDIASYGNLTFSQLDGYLEEPPSQTRTSSEIPSPANPAPAAPSSPPPYPGKPQSSETWKQGTATGPGTEGWNSSSVAALPSPFPTRTTPLRRTDVLTARAQSSSTAPAVDINSSKPVSAAISVPDNDPIYGKLDGCPPPTPPEEAPHQTTATATSYEDPVFSQLDGYPEAPPPRTRPPPPTPAPVDSTLATQSAPPAYPGQSQNSESWKEGTVAGANAESWK